MTSSSRGSSARSPAPDLGAALRAVHANCFPPAGLTGDVLVCDEPVVTEPADGAIGPLVRSPEAHRDPELAHRTSQELWRLAHTWFRTPTGDPTLVAGVSAGDLAGLEAAISVLGPVARGVLSVTGLDLRALDAETWVSVAPQATVNGSAYDRWEGLAADAAVEAIRQRCGDQIAVERVRSSDPRNAILRDKYARTRDAEFLLHTSPTRRARRAVQAAAEAIALIRRRSGRSLLVVEYNPTAAFARRYAALPAPRRRLVRIGASPRAILGAALAGDIVQTPPTFSARSGVHPAACRLAQATDLAGQTFAVDGIELWPLVAQPLAALVSRYAHFAQSAAPIVRRQLQRWRVEAVILPFDNNPATRLILRVAQSLEIPTFSINDGYKGDDIQSEGMSTSVALPWSRAIAEGYFARHPGRVVVCGNPHFESVARPSWRRPPPAPVRVLVGSFTFSPVDLNCRRGDPERFLDEVLTAIRDALPDVAATVVVKLHPADEPGAYDAVIARHHRLTVQLRTTGDVMDMLADGDVYVTTYSTSLLEAALVMPTIFYHLNEQRLMAPFTGDPYLAARTATTPGTLTGLLRDGDLLATPPPAGWSERYLGPAGATARIAEVVETEITSAQNEGEARRAPGAARQA